MAETSTPGLHNEGVGTATLFSHERTEGRESQPLHHPIAAERELGKGARTTGVYKEPSLSIVDWH